MSVCNISAISVSFTAVVFIASFLWLFLWLLKNTMSPRGRQPLGVVVSFFRLLKSFHLLSLRKQFTERIIHYPRQSPRPPKLTHPAAAVPIITRGQRQCQRADPNPVGRPTPSVSASRLSQPGRPTFPRKAGDCPQQVAIPIDQRWQADRTSRNLSLYRHPPPLRATPVPTFREKWEVVWTYNKDTRAFALSSTRCAIFSKKAPVSMLNGIGLKVAPVGLHCRTSDSEKSHQRLSLVIPATRRGRTSNSKKSHQQLGVAAPATRTV